MWNICLFQVTAKPGVSAEAVGDLSWSGRRYRVQDTGMIVNNGHGKLYKFVVSSLRT